MKTSEDTRLLQEIFAGDPWKLLVCCVLLNQTTRRQVDALLDSGFFILYPYPTRMAEAVPEDLAFDIKQLGFQNVRAMRLIEMSMRWTKALRESRGNGERWPSSEVVASLPGVGDYAEDSYRFFVLNDFSSFKSGDKELKAFMREQVGKGGGPVALAIVDGMFGPGSSVPGGYKEILRRIEEGW